MILLSPAKTLDFESKGPVEEYSEPLFPERAAYLASKLKKMSARKLKSMMDISEDLAQLNAQRYREWSLPFTPSNAKQAVYAFKGDVYVGMNADSFSKTDMKFAQDHLRILSGLYGMLRPLDLMQAYRLEMGTSWAITPKTNSLYKYWKTILTEEIKNELATTNSKFLLNLASQEYAKAIDFKQIEVPVITPEFKEERGDTFKMISFFAKQARGMMAAYAVKNKISESEDLKGFDADGYTFNERLSNIGKDKWVFTRKPITNNL